MAVPEPNFVILTHSGRVWTGGTKLNAYFAILRDVYVHMQQSGGGDGPDKLLMDGQMVVPNRLSDIAFAYCREEDEARWAAQRAAKAKHWPDWLPKPEAK